MSRIFGALFSLLSTLALLAPISASAKEARVSFEGYGPARIGMSKQALKRELGSELAKDDATEDSGVCEVVAAVNGQDGVAYMFLDGKLARIDIASENLRTVSGAKFGTSDTAVMALYPGRIVVTPHFYASPDGFYLTLISSNRMRGIRFESDKGQVTHYYAGTVESIQYVEGCQ